MVNCCGDCLFIFFITLCIDKNALHAGAVLHWLHYLPHYKTIPEPAPQDKDDNLLRRRDVYKESALQIASYATRPDRKVSELPSHCSC
jgi:hypothetical protein